MPADAIRSLLAAHARLLVPVETLSDSSDLYEVGLTSLTTVNLMLAIEEHFDIEFRDGMLGRRTFATIAALSEAVSTLQGEGRDGDARAARRVA